MPESSDKPLVSIITPSYNQGQFVEDTILSVRNQDYPNIEHVIVDGGSTDNTLEILKKYEGTYNMRWISEPDEGQADAVNKGFALAQGSIIGWLNSDDIYFFKNVIFKVVKEFKIRTDLAVIYGDIAFVDRENALLTVKCTSSYNYQRLVNHRCFISQPATFFRRCVVDRYQLKPHLHYVMDSEFFLRIGQYHKFRHINKVLAAFRYHKSSKTVTAKTNNRREAERALLEKWYNQSSTPYILKIWDIVSSRLPRRLRSLAMITLLYLRKPSSLAFKATYLPLQSLIKYQVYHPLRTHRHER